MNVKDISISVKAGPDDGLASGQFSAYCSVFGNEDSYGDVVAPGAFTDTLAEWAASGDPLPLLWGHNFSDPDYNIGHVAEAVEDERGLLVTGQLDLDAPKAAQVYRLLKSGRVKQMSFAYDVIDGGPVTVDGGSYYELRKLKIHEVSVVPLGANQETEVLAVKAAATILTEGIRAGRVLSQKHIDSLRSAQEAIGAALTAADDSEEEKTSGHTDAKPETDAEGSNVKSSVPVEEQRVSPSVDSVLASIALIELERSWV